MLNRWRGLWIGGDGMYDIVQGILLGVIQGLTEFLPISSSGHLVLVREWFGLSEAGLLFDTFMHFGTLFAVLILFRREFLHLLCHPFSPLMGLLIVGTLPAVVIGVAFADFFARVAETGETIGWEFLATGLILLWADRYREKGGKMRIEDLRMTDALWIGTLQGAAILPALSRSGLTLAGALFVGMEKEEAARFSFLLSVPAILGANLFLPLYEMSKNKTLEQVHLLLLLSGGISAFIAGYIAIRWMLHLLRKGSLKIFAYYVFALGGLILLYRQFIS